ncbi:MAG: DUF3179 domain-containing (seleno)protein [Pseudomonadota bacterium]
MLVVLVAGLLPGPSRALPVHVLAEYGVPPAVPNGALSEDLERAIQMAFVDSMTQSTWGRDQEIALMDVGASGDPRLAWIISDMLRFIPSRSINSQLAAAASELMGQQIPGDNAWGELTDLLIAWDIPAPPGYLAVKRSIFTTVLPDWEPLFVEGDIDWRHVSWGGVPMDGRPFGQTDSTCNCIPAADNPAVSTAEEATWLKDSDVVFGIVVNGEARAYPRRIMEVREMVNDTLGGRDLGIPYCTLCGAAQAYFTDAVPAGVTRPTLRTSGLLIRSNKVMFDLETMSVLDTFLGRAVTGPLAEKGVVLQQASVVTSEWGAWKAAHPQTTVLVEGLALGRDFDFRNGRDANGPIFPVGDVDPRLSVHEDVIGVVTASGTPVAFQRSKAFTALSQGQEVSVENVRLVMDGTGIKAVDEAGEDLGSHQAFWFAWSQFHPGTDLWEG